MRMVVRDRHRPRSGLEPAINIGDAAVPDDSAKSLGITAHAARRYAERVRRTKNLRAEIRHCITGAHRKRLRDALAGDDINVPTGCCMLVCKDGMIVTVTPISANLVPTRKAKRPKR